MSDELRGMSLEALKHAKTRIHRHVPRCVCGDSLTNMLNARQAICNECSRLYVSKTAMTAHKIGMTVLGDSITETVQVFFNGNIEIKTFIWEL